MPPKNPPASREAERPPIEIDPALLAQHLEERRHFERNEMIARQRVEAMENVGRLCALNEKEKRLNPAGWAEKTAVKGPSYVYVKLLTGNRAIPQLNFRVAFTASMTLNLFKQAIKAEAAKYVANQSLLEWFAPENQRLHLLGKDICCADEFNRTMKEAGIPHGSTILLTVHPGVARLQMPPSAV